MRYFSDEDAINFMTEYLAKDEQGFYVLESVQYLGTFNGVSETCAGCTLGDGQDCCPPQHFVDEFLVICKDKKMSEGNLSDIRRSNLSMGWAEGSCSNSYGDYKKVVHC